MGARQPLELYRALPSAPTFNSARPLRKEFHIPVTPPCTHRRLSGRPLNCVLIFFNVLYMCFFVFSTVYHSRRHKSIKKRKYSPAKYKCFSGTYHRISFFPGRSPLALTRRSVLIPATALSPAGIMGISGPSATVR